MAQTDKRGPWSAPKLDPRTLESLARDVAEVLERMGGSAHETLVVECVAAMKRQRGEAVAADLKARIIEVFERYRELFFRPFGEGSHRWALATG